MVLDPITETPTEQRAKRRFGGLCAAEARIAGLVGARVAGTVSSADGLGVTIQGISPFVSVGDRLNLIPRPGGHVDAEVVGFAGGVVRAMAFQTLDGIGPGSRAVARAASAAGGLAVTEQWLGRVVDPLGQPIDGKGPLPGGPRLQPIRAAPPDATLRGRLGPRIDLGIRALNVFTTCREGQRLGLFAGSGVGKSTLLSMLARHTACDVTVVALVGERGREVREFIEDDLGPDGLARTVLVVATSDASPLMRREAAYAAMTIAEHFRDQGKSVMLLMDSVTRFCFALREIGLAAGQPPATRGYPPGVFAELPKLLERAGPGAPRAGGGGGHITAIFTVLVDGDDMNEPVADAVRGFLDGHIILDRKIGEQGRYPAIDILRSLSRSVPACNSDHENALVAKARALLATHAEIADLVRLGAYKAGTDKAADEALVTAPRIEALLRQTRTEHTSLEDGFTRLAGALAIDPIIPPR